MSKGGLLIINEEKFVLKFGKEYLIGRKSNELSHDIEIDDPSVDIKHSILDLTQSSSPQLFDVCSKHGTFVDGLRVTKLRFTKLPKTSKIRFGNVEASLQLLTESDSGFLEERLSSPTKDTSDIICNTPNQISTSQSRLKNSLTSTPNAPATSNENTTNPDASKSIDNFVIPTRQAPRTSLHSNTSARSSDSFCIPETQYPQEAISNETNNSTDISVYSNKSKRHSTLADGDDDFFIPETQEVVVTKSAKSAIPHANLPRIAFPNDDDVNETLSEEDKIPSSQFRICTQDYNGSDEDIGNHSGDLLANIPMSLVIPPIQYDAVQIDDFIKVDTAEADNVDDDDDDFVKDVEKEVEKEMSALEWSKRTNEDADGSVTPDGLFDVVGSVTADLVKVKSPDKASSQNSTPDIFGNPDEKSIDEILKEIEKEEKQEEIDEAANPTDVVGDENATKTEETKETEYPPTQAFFKPIPNNLSDRSVTAIADGDDCELPATQAFSPPKCLPKSVVSKFNKSLPETQVFTPPRPVAVVLHDSLPPTQAFTPPKVPGKPKTSAHNHVFALPLASPKPLKVAKESPKPQTTPKAKDSPITTSVELPKNTAEDDLPPTQVFQREDHNIPPVPAVNQQMCFSSTLVDTNMQLSENSFKAKFNKLLDSDDDEMDEVIAPELVKQMRRRSAEKSSETSNRSAAAPVENPDVVVATPKQTEMESKKKSSPAPASTPVSHKFQVPLKTPKAQPTTVSIENFMLTPDFLGKEISKNSQLQREAEINWRNLVLQKRNQELFGNSPDDSFANLDDSQDSFVDLLPKKREERTKSVNKMVVQKDEAVIEKKDTRAAKVCPRITRRKSAFPEEKQEPSTKNKKEEKRGRKKKEETVKPAKDTKKEENSSNDSKTIEKPKLVENSYPNKNSSSLKELSVPLKKDKSNSSSAIQKSTEDITTSDSKDKKPSAKEEEKSTKTTRRKAAAMSPPPEKKIENEKLEEKPKRTRAAKRTAESTKSSIKSSKINKLDEVATVRKQVEAEEKSKPSPRVTRLRSATVAPSSAESKVQEKKIPSNNSRKKKEASGSVVVVVEKQEPANNSVVDLTDDDQSLTNKKPSSRKRKSQEDIPYKVRLNGSQSSVDSADSDRTLRRKKKLKIAMTSCSETTREALTRFSGKVWDYTEDPKECDVLILEVGNRTYKLLVAIARGVPVVKVDWLKEVLTMKTTNVDFDRFIFEDANFQKRHKFVMKEVLQSARTALLFRDLFFMMTPNISPKPDEMRDIITSAGGTVLSAIPSPSDNKSFYLVSEKADCQLWHRYRRASQNVKVVQATSLMASVMQQSLEPLKRTLN